MKLLSTDQSFVALVVVVAALFHLPRAKGQPQWSPWNPDVPCTVTCGEGYAERIRICSTGNSRDCHGAPWEVVTCNLQSCSSDSTPSTTTFSKMSTTTPPIIESTTASATDLPTTSMTKSSTILSTKLATSTSSNSLTMTTKPDTTTTAQTTSTVTPSTASRSLPSTLATTSKESPSTLSMSSATTSIATPITTSDSIPPGHTIAPNPTTCAQCLSTTDQCEILYFPEPCDPPNNYCINHVINHVDGSRYVNRTCGDINTCYNDWYRRSSDVETCQSFDGNNVVAMEFECTFCCVTDNCNVPLKPRDVDLYTDM